MISQNIKEKIHMIAECIRRRIRNYCEERKLSLYAFAQGANISYSTLRDFMNEATIDLYPDSVCFRICFTMRNNIATRLD